MTNPAVLPARPRGARAIPATEEEYLRDQRDHAADYIDGFIVERDPINPEETAPTKHHSLMQAFLIFWFGIRRELGFCALPEQHVRIAPGRWRIPDICVLPLPLSDEPYVTEPPLLCIEILSPQDTYDSIQERVEDYLAFGVPHVWVIDPIAKRGRHITQEGARRIADGRFDAPFAVDLREME